MKHYHRYQMDFDGKGSWLSGIFIGLPVFLLCVYYLFLQEINAVAVGRQLLHLWLPIILSIAYLVLLRLVRWNAPGVFAILGAAVSLLLIIQLFGTGNVLRIVLGILGYVAGGGLLVLCAGGFLPGRMIVSLIYLIILLMRLLIFRNVSGSVWLQEISCLSYIAGLMFLPVAFKEIRK